MWNTMRNEILKIRFFIRIELSKKTGLGAKQNYLDFIGAKMKHWLMEKKENKAKVTQYEKSIRCVKEWIFWKSLK